MANFPSQRCYICCELFELIKIENFITLPLLRFLYSTTETDFTGTDVCF